MSKSHIAEWDKNAELYNKSQGEIGDVAHQLLFDPIIEEKLGDLSNKVVLDAGCGNGYWVRRLAKKAKKVVGIDGSSKLIRIAQYKDNPPNTEFHVSDLMDKIDLPSDSFDVVLSSMVLHYLPSIKNMVSESKRLLKTRGIIVICVQHPFYQYHFRARDLLGKKSGVFPKTVGYFHQGLIEQVTLFGKATFTGYNRTVESYMIPFLDNGFHLIDYAEPEYPTELLKKHPKYKEVKEVPRVMIAKYQKA